MNFLATIRDTEGKGNSAIYVRLLNNSLQYLNFATQLWVDSETAECRVFLTEHPDASGESRYAATLDLPAGTAALAEYVELVTADVLGEEAVNSTTGTTSPPTPPARAGYTTLEDVALFLNIEENTLTLFEAAQIRQLIPFVAGVIDNYCGYALAATAYTNKAFDGTGTNTLDLRVYPVNSVTEIKISQGDGTFIDYTADVEILEDGIIRFKPEIGGTFTAGTSNVIATFNAGMPNIPEDIAFAATYLVAINFNKISRYLIGISEQSATGTTTKYDSIELPVMVKRVLDRYRKISIF